MLPRIKMKTLMMNKFKAIKKDYSHLMKQQRKRKKRIAKVNKINN